MLTRTMVDDEGMRAPDSVEEVVYEPAFINMPAQAKETFLETVAEEMEEHGDAEEAIRSGWDALSAIYGAEGKEEGFDEILPNP